MTPQDHLQQIRNRLPQPPIIHSSQPQQAYTNQMSQVIISRVSLNTRTLYIYFLFSSIGFRYQYIINT